AKEVGLAMRTAIRQSRDYKEGREAFLEKRSPNFKGA
ncbi:MAG: 1,4-dihydroxy-2-naphthoyl-CoA synthase, partial [Planctomycetaceae bacterium]